MSRWSAQSNCWHRPRTAIRSCARWAIILKTRPGGDLQRPLRPLCAPRQDQCHLAQRMCRPRSFTLEEALELIAAKAAKGGTTKSKTAKKPAAKAKTAKAAAKTTAVKKVTKTTSKTAKPAAKKAAVKPAANKTAAKKPATKKTPQKEN